MVPEAGLHGMSALLESLERDGGGGGGGDDAPQGGRQGQPLLQPGKRLHQRGHAGLNKHVEIGFF